MHERVPLTAETQPAPRISDRLNLLRRRRFVGRERELHGLEQCASGDGPAVSFVYGIGGMGKTALLDALETRLIDRRVRVLRVDGQAVAPTPGAFCRALAVRLEAEYDSESLDSSTSTPSTQLAAMLSGLSGITVILIDHYEQLRLLDAWLRTDLAPRLPAPVRLVVAGRHPPALAWAAGEGWAGLVQSMQLDALDEKHARRALRALNTPADKESDIIRFAQGHPLTLELAHAAAVQQPNSDFGGLDRSRTIAQLARLFLEELTSGETRRALEAASVVRRASRSFLSSMLGPEPATRAIEQLERLGLVCRAAEGLTLHPVVRQAIAGELQTIDPQRHRELRRAAWTQLRSSLSSLGPAHLWEHAADALFLIEHAHIREAFFPSGVQRIVVEPARVEDWPAIAAISAGYDSAEGVAVLKEFFRLLPDCVHVARDELGEVQAFYALVRSDRVPDELLRCDPLLAQWLQHDSDPEPALWLRRMLARDHGNDANAACVLDLKRTYIENPRTTKLYVGASALTRQPEWAALGFQECPALTAAGLARDGAPHITVCLEFGSGGIFGWIGRLVDAQYAPPHLTSESAASQRVGIPQLHLDEDLRQLVVDGTSITLTPLQFNLLQHLMKNTTRVIDRAELVDVVWGQGVVGSNVVDAAVRSLRKKLGRHAGVIETAKGFGYRFRWEGLDSKQDR